MTKPFKMEPIPEEDIQNLRRLTAAYPPEQEAGPHIIIDEDPPTIESANRPITEPNEIGRLSAEAVQSQYEAAAKAVEDMGTAVIDRIKKLENALRECDRDMKLLGEVAATIRDKGNLVYAQIEETSSVSKDLRATAEGFRTRVQSP
jgi:predicted ribosome quality control (RQC) complex YloA/Tae2 family protein